MRMSDGKCDDVVCPYRTNTGYCMSIGCLKDSSTTTNTISNIPINLPIKNGYIEVGSLTKITDSGMKDYIRLYLKDHTLSDLFKILSEIV